MNGHELLAGAVPPEPPRKRTRPFRAGIIRIDGDGWFHLMNKQETGWASSSYWYPTLEALLDGWDIVLGAEGEDKHSRFIRFELPKGEESK